MPTEMDTAQPSLDPKEGIPLDRANSLLLVMGTAKGRGIFASRDIPARTVLEVCPVLVLSAGDNENHIEHTELYHYTYNWPSPSPAPKNKDSKNQNQTNEPLATKPPPVTTLQAVAFGLGSLFNHSTFYRNVLWERDVPNLLITYTTLRDIKAGEELCISYGSNLTFTDTEEPWDAPGDWQEVMSYIELVD